jgi:hypothetical protein
MQLTRGSCLGLAVLAGLAAAPRLAHADGWLSMRGAYYKEYSTRVTPPMIDGAVDLSSKDSLQFHGLVDSITSASMATGAAAAPGTTFNEKRYEGGLGLTHSFGDLVLGASYKSSSESDYDSTYVDVRGELALDEKNTVVALTLGRSFDRISNGVSASELVPLEHEKLRTGLTSLSLTQLLGPRLIGYLTYDFMDWHGYQANIYRRVTGGQIPVPERVPELRLRNALYAGVRGFLPETATTGVLGYRLYFDDWGVVSHTLEARVIQQILPGLDVRLRYRVYVQSKADFYQDTYTAEQIADQMVYVTEDAKLASMTTHVLGGQVVVALGLFGVTGSWADVRLDAIVERILQDTYFGDAWSGQVGLMVPFAY